MYVHEFFIIYLKVMAFMSDPDVGSETGLHKLRSATAASHIFLLYFSNISSKNHFRGDGSTTYVQLVKAHAPTF